MLARADSIIVVSLLVLTFCVSASAQRIFTGQVIDIIDGKTVVLAMSSGKINAELQFIDVPGEGHLMSGVVREHLRNMVIGKTVEYRPRNIQRDRTIGKMTLNNVDLSQQMLRDGAAWHMPVRLSGQDEADFQVYASTEAVAKNEKRGVWGVPDLRPSWEQQVVSSNDASAARNGSAGPTRPRGAWGDKNPRLANIGALVNGYNAASRTGYLSTSLLGSVNLDGNKFDGEFSLDITYLYKEGDGRIGRKGIFVATLVCESEKMHFVKNNDMVAVFDDKRVNLGRPERFVKKDGLVKREVLQYRMSKETLHKLVNSDTAYLKLGRHCFYMITVRYLLYNMLQLAGES